MNDTTGRTRVGICHAKVVYETSATFDWDGQRATVASERPSSRAIVLDGEAAAILAACSKLRDELESTWPGRIAIESWVRRFEELADRVIELQPKPQILDELNLVLDTLLFDFNATRPNRTC